MVNPSFLDSTPLVSTYKEGGYLYKCYQTGVFQDNGIWRQTNPLSYGLPVFLSQLILITSLHRLLLFFKPFHQPAFVAEILAGVVFGPSAIGKLQETSPLIGHIFAAPRVILLESLGYLGLNYTLFLIGLEMDVTVISRVGKKAMTIALAGVFFPFLVGVLLYYLLLHRTIHSFNRGCLYWGVCLAVTGLPVVSEVLAKTKLLHSDTGKAAMSAALVTEVASWALFALIVPFGDTIKIRPFFSMLGTIVFVVACVYIVRPIVLWVISKTQNGEELNDTTVCFLLTALLGCGLATDVAGTSSMVGSYVFGLIIPHGLLGHRFLEVLEGFMSNLLMPIFFVLSGFRTDLDVLMEFKTSGLVFLVVIVACLAKVVSTVVASLFFDDDTPIREGVALGVLMNTKGLLAIIAINVARDRMVFGPKEFSVMLVAVLVMTMGTVPFMKLFYRSTRRFLPSKHRAIQRLKPDAELRLLACVHEVHTIPGIINLLHASNPTKNSPVCVFALQLIELTGHGSALLVVHGPSRSNSQNSRGDQPQLTDQIAEAFEKLELENGHVSVQPLNATSSYTTMHEDICSVAEDKRVTLIILPFHKRQSIHNKMESTNPAYKEVNEDVLGHAPCSVGILVDRGIGTVKMDLEKPVYWNIAVPFLGGKDDREALHYALRMAGNSTTTLTVVRFLPGMNTCRPLDDNGEVPAAAATDNNELENRADNDFVTQFKSETEGDESVRYSEKVVNDGEETVAALKSMGENYDLYVVGRGIGRSSSTLTAGFGDWSECPELGPIGDLLTGSDFLPTVSVLVVQQFEGGRIGDGLNKNAGLRQQLSDGSSVPFVSHSRRWKDDVF